MQQFAWEKYNLVLLWNDRLEAALADVDAFFQPRIMNPQFPTFELPRFAMKEVDKRQMARASLLAAVVCVKAEEVAVVAGRHLRLDLGDREFFHAKFIQHL